MFQVTSVVVFVDISSSQIDKENRKKRGFLHDGVKWVVNCLHSSFHDSMDSLFKLLYHVISLFRSVVANILHLTTPRTLRYSRIVFMFLICSFGFVVLSYGSICGGFFNPIEIWVSWILLVKGLRRPLSSSFGVEDHDWQGFPIGWCLVPLQKKNVFNCRGYLREVLQNPRKSN